MEPVSLRSIIAQEKGIEKAEILLLLSHVLSSSKERIISRLDEEISHERLEEFRIKLRERKNGKPLSYITGRREFFSLEFLVTEATLIPRPETEILVEEALRILEDPGLRWVLDVGTGCGNIGITLAKLRDVRVICVDISKDALSVAKRNSIIHGVSEKVSFICSDLLSSIRGRFDLICANLPYVSDEDYDRLPKDIKFYEPKLALYGGKDGLEVIMRFLKDLEEFLSDGGYVLVEIGSERQLSQIKELLQRKGFLVSSIKDYSNIERVVKAKWISS